MPSSHGSPALLIDVSGLAPGPPFGAGDRDVVGVALRDAGRDRTDADFAHQLHAHASGRIRVLQIEDELREILDRINVVMRRRADESDPRRAVSSRRDDLIDLVAGQFASLAGLRPLSDLDLQLVGVREIPARHAEATARDLLDCRRRFESPFDSGEKRL